VHPAIAMHDAANAGASRYPTHTGIRSSTTGYDAAAAAVVAAHDVLVGFFPAQTAIASAALEASLLDAGIGPAVEAGRNLGADAAAANHRGLSRHDLHRDRRRGGDLPEGIPV
jgi:hypothetical protein